MASDVEGMGRDQSDLLSRLQKVLESDNGGDSKFMEGSLQNCLSVLEQRLLRVRSWGGAYSEVDFSPDVKAMLGDDVRLRRRVLVS